MLSDVQIKDIANKIVKLNLATPCIFLLEAHLPLSGIFHAVSLGLAPLFVSVRGYQNFSNFFAEPKNIERLIEELK